MAATAGRARRAVTTISLRTATRADSAWVDAWLPDVATSLGYDPANQDRSQKRLIIRRDANGSRSAGDPAREDVGVLIYRLSTPARGDAMIELVATPPQHARKGAGMAAAALLEEDLRRRGVRRVYAPAPAVHGIAMYFWIRLGYRPLLRGDWPCAREGVAWLVRDLTQHNLGPVGQSF